MAVGGVFCKFRCEGIGAGCIKPQRTTLKSKAPRGAEWAHEIKYDSYYEFSVIGFVKDPTSVAALYLSLANRPCAIPCPALRT